MAPKQPISPFLVFSREKRPEVSRQYAHLTFGEVSKQLGEIWKGMSDEEKEVRRARTLLHKWADRTVPLEIHKRSIRRSR